MEEIKLWNKLKDECAGEIDRGSKIPDDRKKKSNLEERQ